MNQFRTPQTATPHMKPAPAALYGSSSSGKSLVTPAILAKMTIKATEMDATAPHASMFAFKASSNGR